MGGNVKVGNQGSEPITINMRKDRRKDIEQMLHSINRDSDHQIFGYGAPSLTNGSAYSGSTAHMMDKSLKDEELGKFKKSFGDVDVMVPKNQETVLKGLLQPGAKHGKFTVVGTKHLGGQASVIMKHDDGKHHQVDFEYKNFDEESQEPDSFARFSQNAHIDDMKAGLKGAAHKALVLALTAKDGKKGIIEKIKKGVTSYSSEQPIRSNTFSQMYGMRSKHIPSIDTDGNHKKHNGKLVYNELGAEHGKYETDLSKIHEMLFGVEGKDSDVEKLHSFGGVAKLMKKHLQPHEVRSVVDQFASNLYDKRAATHMSGDPKKDNEMKVHALRELRKHFPEHFDKLMYDTISERRAKYYDKPNMVNEDMDTPIKIVLGAGRFTGPTKEHEKLIDKIFEQEGDYHYIYVMGPTTLDETTSRDPLTVARKVAILQELYPEKADSFVPGCTPRTKTPLQAMINSYHLHEASGRPLELVVVAGDGDAGLTGKDAGGSAGVYEDMINRVNGTTFNDGSYRMNYAVTEVVRNPRGDFSGTILRESAANNDFDKFLEGIHSRMPPVLAKRVFNEMNKKTELVTDVIAENYHIVEAAANDLGLPVEVIEAIVVGVQTVEQLVERTQSICTRIQLDEHNRNLYPNAKDTFVIMYQPEKLFYQVERVNVMPNEDLREQAVIAERIRQGYMITSTHVNTTDPQLIQGSHRHQMRKYRRQIDD